MRALPSGRIVPTSTSPGASSRSRSVRAKVGAACSNSAHHTGWCRLTADHLDDELDGVAVTNGCGALGLDAVDHDEDGLGLVGREAFLGDDVTGGKAFAVRLGETKLPAAGALGEDVGHPQVDGHLGGL